MIYKQVVLSLVIILTVVTSVTAAFDVHFDLNDNAKIEAFAFECSDSACESVGSFRGSFLSDNPTTSEEMLLRFDTVQANSHGSGIIFVKENHVPKAFRVRATGTASTAHSLSPFTQRRTCAANISDLRVRNVFPPYGGVTIGFAGNVSMTIHSPFAFNSDEVRHIPSQLREKYYAAESVKVKTDIFQDSSLISSSTEVFSSQNDNALVAGESAKVSMNFLPLKKGGDYFARVETEVIDPSCTATVKKTDTVSFSVTSSANPEMSNFSHPSFVQWGETIPFVVTAFDDEYIANVLLHISDNKFLASSRNNNNNIFAVHLSDFSVGNHTFRWEATDNKGNRVFSPEQSVIVKKALPIVFFSVAGKTADTVSVFEDENITLLSESWIPSDGVITLFVDGRQLASGAGRASVTTSFAEESSVHNVTVVYSGSENYSATSRTITVFVGDNTGPIITTPSSFSVPTGANFSREREYSFAVNVSDGTVVNTVVGSIDGVPFTASRKGATNEFFIRKVGLSGGNHSLQWFANDTSGNSVTSNLENYEVLRIASRVAMNISPNSTLVRGQEGRVSCAEPFFADDLVFSLKRNAVSIPSAVDTTSSLGPGVYEYRCSTAGNENLTASSAVQNVTITKSIPSLRVLINGTNGDVVIPENSSVFLTAQLVNPVSGTVKLLVGEASPLLSLASGLGNASTVFSPQNAGFFEVRAIFLGNSEFLPLNVSRRLIVGSASVINVSPRSGTLVNSPFLLQATTRNITACRAGLTDTETSNMSIPMITSNGVNHSASVFVPRLGVQAVHLGCTDETAGSNTDLTYTIDNVFVNTVIDTTSSVTNSLFNNSGVFLNSSLSSSTVVDSTINFSDLFSVTSSDATITGSSLSNCIVSNALVKNIIATHCILANGTYDPPAGLNNLTESNLTSTDVFSSNVTFSQVSGASITNATITRSTISNASVRNVTITDSSIQNMSGLVNSVLISATIEDNILLSGVLEGSTGRYNATASGPRALKEITNIAPRAFFAVSPSTQTEGESVSFNGSASIDPNLNSSLNDSLSFFYLFGDGTNASAQVATHSFSTPGTFTVTLLVTDWYNVTSSFSRSVVITEKDTSSNDDSGSGSGSGSSGGGTDSLNHPRVLRVNLSETEQVFRLSGGESLQFEEGRVKILTLGRVTSEGEIFFHFEGQQVRANESDVVSFISSENKTLFIRVEKVAPITNQISTIAVRLASPELPNALDSILALNLTDNATLNGTNGSSVNVTVDVPPSLFDRIGAFFSGLSNTSITGGVGLSLPFELPSLPKPVVGTILTVLVVLLGLASFFMVRKILS